MEWPATVLLGAYHGINPGMGWLFAVALGLQQGSARGVWQALPPIAAGHALSVSVVLVAAGLAQVVVPPDTVNGLIAALLISVGVYRLKRHRHPRFGGMQVGFRDLTTWSFLMASAHGAGLMLVPVAMHRPGPLSATSHGHAHHAVMTNVAAVTANAFAIHTLSYLVVTTFAAWIVYHKLGVGVLRSAWFNVDQAWATALVVAGIVVLLN